MELLKRLLAGDDGQDLVEYSLLLVLVGIGTILVLQQTGSSVAPIMSAGNTVIMSALSQSS